MKKTRLVYGALAILAVGMTACSSDAPDNNLNGPLENDEIRYLRVNLVSQSGPLTKAEFDEGTPSESYVENITMDFYDASGNFVTRANPSDVTWNPDNGTAENPGSTNTGNVGKVGSAIVKIGLEKNQNLPAYVMCYVNPVEWGETADTPQMQNLRQVKRTDYKNGNNHFAMNNSCYYGTDAITGQANVKISGTPVVAGALYTTEAAANADDAAVVNIYVERYAAKVQFYAVLDKKSGSWTEGGKGVYPYTGTTKVGDDNINYSLDFNAERWTINADAPDMFAVKSFATTSYTDPIPSFNTVNAYLSPWTTWNDETNRRSYWSCSPAYFATDFPQVSDQIAEKDAAGTGAGKVVAPYGLKYYSYNQICGSNGNGIADFAAETDGTLPCKYALENTVGKAAFASLNPKAAVPSVLLVGNYRITYGGSTIPANTSFYIFNGGLYFNELPTGVDNVVLMKDKFVSQQMILYVKVGDEYKLLRQNNAGDIVNSLVVKHPSAAVRGKQLVPHRFVTLQINDADDATVPNGVYFLPNGSNEYTPVTADNLTVVNKLLWQQSNVAYAYTNGKCYFSMPIQHLGISENGKVGDAGYPLDADGKLNWKSLRVGDMGLVRNHIYTLGVEAITGLASGIENLDYPIVPPMDQDEYWIKYKINILNWRIVPVQDGIILK